LIPAVCVFAWPLEPGEMLIRETESRFFLDTSGRTDCAPTVRETFTRFHVRRRDFHGNPPALVRQDFEIGSGCFVEYKPARVSLSAQPLNLKTGRTQDTILWRFSAEGTSGFPEPDIEGLYRIDHPGCCSSANTAKYFSLITGKQIGSSTSKLLELPFHEATERRYMTAEDNTASSPWKTPSDAAEIIATVFFGSDEALMQSVSIQIPKNHEAWMATLDYDTAYTTSGGKAILTLQCRCEGKGRIELPFSISGINIKAARIKGLKGAQLMEKRQ
jgi:hypothetical protein